MNHVIDRRWALLDDNGLMGKLVGDAGIRALVCADLACGAVEVSPGSSRAFERIVRQHRGTPLEELTRHAATFGLASDAMLAALAVRAAFRVRVSVDVVETGRDGTATAQSAARCEWLLEAANHGQVVASSAAVDLASDAIADVMQLTDLGVHHIRRRPDRMCQPCR